MGTEADLHMMQLADSLFPTGLFSMSGGIETMFRDGAVTSARELRGLLATVVAGQLGPFDCVRAACAHRSPGRAATLELDAACNAMRSNREAREASCRSGGQLARCVAGFAGGEAGWYCRMLREGRASGEYPVSFGLCCRAVGIEEGRVPAMLLYGSVAGSVGAALRLGLIDHMEGQEVIHSLKPAIAEAARESLGVPASEAWQFAPQAEIYQMAHEDADSRMFAT